MQACVKSSIKIKPYSSHDADGWKIDACVQPESIQTCPVFPATLLDFSMSKSLIHSGLQTFRQGVKVDDISLVFISGSDGILQFHKGTRIPPLCMPGILKL